MPPPAAGAEDPREFRFQRLSAVEGLAQSSVYALLQDHHGFVWMGTQDGLQRWDGYRFETFRPDPYGAAALPSGQVHALLEDRAQRLWVGTYKGLARLDASGRGFERPLGDEAHNVLALLEDREGTVWVGTRGAGLFLFDPGGKRRQMPDGTEVYRLQQ